MWCGVMWVDEEREGLVVRFGDVRGGDVVRRRELGLCGGW